MDILDERHSLRRISNLVHRLPATSELYADRSQVDRVERAWSTTDYLLAHVVDLLQIQNYQFAAAHSKHRPAQKPKPLQRPRDAAPKPKRGWVGRTIYTPKE